MPTPHTTTRTTIRTLCRRIAAGICVAALAAPLSLYAQAQRSSSSSSSSASSTDKQATNDPKTVKRSKVVIVNSDGNTTTRTFSGDSSTIEIDFPEIGDSIRAKLREVMKDLGALSIEGENGSFRFSFKKKNGKQEHFSIEMDSAFGAIGKALKMPRIHVHRFGGGRFSTPYPPRAPRVLMFDDNREFSSKDAQRLENEAKAMQAEAEAMRKEAEAARLEAEAMRKRAEALRLEAKAQQAAEAKVRKEQSTQSSEAPAKKK